MSITEALPAGMANAPARADTASNRIVNEALAADKREGLVLAVRARWAALAVIAILIIYVNPHWEMIYYQVLLAGFAVIGWLQLRLGRVGRSRPELALLFCDLALMTFTLMVPNPLTDGHWPAAMQYRFDNFPYFFVLLASATLAYHWRTLIAFAVWAAALWLGAMVWAIYQPVPHPELSEGVRAVLADHPRMIPFLDPYFVNVPSRIQEVVVLLIVAATLAIAGWRSNRLLLKHAGVERERANLARYFSPNVVDELSSNDEPLKQVRTQNVAVLFVDIVGFTAYSDMKAPHQVIATLREFHALMEHEVFRHAGTLDKYLGDGLMATFGTPTTGSSDASNALRCARAMITVVDRLNAARAARGEVPVHAGFGLHYGDAILGDIGANRLEFAVIGRTVNIAARLEALTRDLAVTLVASDDLIAQARSESGGRADDFAGLQPRPATTIRGIAEPLALWTAGPA
jgi:adenylate cyclase